MLGVFRNGASFAPTGPQPTPYQAGVLKAASNDYTVRAALPGQHYASSFQLAPDVRHPLRYDDGYLQRNVVASSVRPAAPPFQGAFQFRVHPSPEARGASVPPPLAATPPVAIDSAEWKPPSPKDSNPGTRTTTSSSRANSTGVRTPQPLPPPPPSCCTTPGTRDSLGRVGGSPAALPAPPPPPPPARGSSFSGAGGLPPTLRTPPQVRQLYKATPEPATAECEDTEEEEEERQEPLEAWEEGGAADGVRRRLADAVISGDAAALQAALAEAQQMGVHCREARRARDTLLAIEASDFRRRAAIVVEEAVESDDWWKLQAAMQVVVGGLGGDTEYVSTLKGAMRMQKRRQEAVRELRKAAEARDAARLRCGIEAALLVHVRESDLKGARDGLRALEARPVLREGLERAIAAGKFAALKEAIEAAHRGKLHERGPELLRADPEEGRALQAAQKKLRELAIADVQRRLKDGNAEEVAQALEEAAVCGVGSAELAKFTEQLTKLKASTKQKQRLLDAVKARTKEALIAAINDAQGFADGEAELKAAKQALQSIEQQEQLGAAQVKAAQELSLAMQTEDANRLANALAAAEHVGLGSTGTTSTLALARERLRLMQARASAVRELREACRSTDMYRLKAAIATAQSAGVVDSMLETAREALRLREGQAKVRQSIETAIMQRDAEMLQTAFEEAQQLGLSRQELLRVEAELNALDQSRIGESLREAMASGDVERLRHLAGVAAAAGLAEKDVANAWDRLRELEAQAWLRKQLEEAVARGDPVRLQTAIKQAEAGGLTGTGLDAARQAMREGTAKWHAIQELRLARSGGNFYSVQAALSACERAGVTRQELAEAMEENVSGGRMLAQAAPGEPPTQQQLPTQAVVFTTDPQFTTDTQLFATDPQWPMGSVATNPQLSSTATIPQVFNSGTVGSATPQLSSVAMADVPPLSGRVEPRLPTRRPTPRSPDESGTRPAEDHRPLQHRMRSQPLRQPLPDEPAASIVEGWGSTHDPLGKSRSSVVSRDPSMWVTKPRTFLGLHL